MLICIHFLVSSLFFIWRDLDGWLNPPASDQRHSHSNHLFSLKAECTCSMCISSKAGEREGDASDRWINYTMKKLLLWIFRLLINCAIWVMRENRERTQKRFQQFPEFSPVFALWSGVLAPLLSVYMIQQLSCGSNLPTYYVRSHRWRRENPRTLMASFTMSVTHTLYYQLLRRNPEVFNNSECSCDVAFELVTNPAIGVLLKLELWYLHKDQAAS